MHDLEDRDRAGEEGRDDPKLGGQTGMDTSHRKRLVSPGEEVLRHQKQHAATFQRSICQKHCPAAEPGKSRPRETLVAQLKPGEVGKFDRPPSYPW